MERSPNFLVVKKGGPRGSALQPPKESPSGLRFDPIWGPVGVPDRAPFGALRRSLSGVRNGLAFQGPKSFPNVIYTILLAICGPSTKGSNRTLGREPI